MIDEICNMGVYGCTGIGEIAISLAGQTVYLCPTCYARHRKNERGTGTLTW